MEILTVELERKVSSTRPALDTTLLRAFDPGVPSLCEYCQTGFSLIAIHQKIFHSGSKEFKCAFCGMPFVNRKGLLDHLDAHSDGNELFCCVCLCEQKSDDALSEHLETHKELHVFLCPKCRRTFASKFGLSGHDCVASTDVRAASVKLQPNVLMVCSGTDFVKTDEEIEIRLPNPGGGCEQPQATGIPSNWTLTPERGLGSDNIFTKSNRPVVKIGQQHLSLSGSTISESISSSTANCEPSVKPLQYLNRETVNGMEQLSLSASTEKTVRNFEDVIEIKVGFEMNQDLVTDHSKCPEQIAVTESVAVKNEIQELISDQCASPEVGGETPYVKVEFNTDQDPSTERCTSVDPNGGNGVNIEFSTDQSTVTDSCANAERDSVDVAFDSHQEVITGDGVIAHGIVDTGCVKVEFDVHQVLPGSCTNAGRSGSNDCVTVEFDSQQSPAPLSQSRDSGGVALPETPPGCKGDLGGGSVVLAQCPSTAVNADTTDLCSFSEKLPQQAALPPDLTTENEVRPEESHTDPKSTVDTRPEEALEMNGRTLRSTRKRCHAATIDRLDSDQLTPSGIQTYIDESAELQPADRTEPTPPDSPPPEKKKRISFNEQIEYWNPILRERAWLDITEEFPEVREVPLLKVSSAKSRKKGKKKSKKRKKDSKSKRSKKSNTEFEEGTPEPYSLTPSRPVPGDITSDGFSTPTRPAGPLRPVLKPSPTPPVIAPPSDLAMKGRWGKDSGPLSQKFGTDFSYRKCLKVDGRYHCPDNECRDNNDRGFSTDKGLRHHIRQNHIEAITYDCTICNKTFPAPSKLKIHMGVHNPLNSYSCSTCDKKFKTKLSLKAHKMRHEQPWGCYHCGLRFSQKESLRVHLRTSECSCCDVVLRCAELFRRHEADVPHLYECSACDKTMRTLQTFNWHVRNIHYEESTALDGTWICHVCERKFTSRSIAVRHARIKHRNCTRDTDQQKPRSLT